LGVRRGDRILVALDNSLDSVVAFYGTLRADCVPSLIGTGMKPRRLAQLVDQAEPSVLVAARALDEHIAAARAAATPPAHVFVAGPDARGKQSAERSLDDLLASAPKTRPPRASIELDLATICWTSGSTGESKGVMLTHQNLRNSSAAIAAYLDHDERDVVLCVLPISHTYGLFQMLVTHWTGGTLVLEKGFSMPWPIVQKLEAHRVTGFAGVPTIYASILSLKNLPSADLSALRYMTNAAYGLPAPQLLRLRELLPNVRFYAMYGQTECTRVCYLPPDLALERPASVGISFPNQEVWISREDGTVAPRGETGELVVRGPNVMRGYWRNPTATARALRPGPIPGEVVLHTGDLFRLDEDGYLHFVARKDDVIKTRGEKVAPLEVEACICKLPGVVEVAVVGMPDPVLGVAVKAVVVKSPESALTADDVRKHVRSELEEAAIPKVVEFADSLPKTSSGKVKKGELL
ncbi:MAG: acyl--CoA ligase, partial [Deltaproteobacteria bacterium]|nr:acyl--CoA ligase [Deltaproteobacteria bacterium]